MGCLTARIDRNVTSTAGKVLSAQPPTVIQPLDQSVIRSLDVREGDRVEKGQVLATLDATFADADVGQLVQQIASLDAQIARDEAEQDGVRNSKAKRIRTSDITSSCSSPCTMTVRANTALNSPGSMHVSRSLR